MSEADRDLEERAGRAIGLSNSLFEMKDPGGQFIWRPLSLKPQAMDLIAKLGLAVAVDRAGMCAYAGSIGEPHEDNPAKVPYHKDNESDRMKALCRAIVTHAALRGHA